MSAENKGLTEKDILEEAERKYRTLFEQSPDGILILDIKGNILDFNTKAHSQLGYSREEFAKLHIADIDPIQSPAEIEKSIQELLKRGKGEFEVKHRTKEGETRDVQVITQTLVLSGQTVFHTIWRDITDHKKADKNLYESEKKYRTLVETADDVILLTDLNGKHLYRNKAYYLSLGYSLDEDVDLDGYSQVHPDDVPLLKNNMRNLLEHGNLTQEYRVRHKDGGWRYRYAKLTLIYDSEQRPNAILAIIRDITERKLGEQALIKNEEKLRTLFSILPVGVSIIDASRGITEMNPALEKVVHMTREGLLAGQYNERKYIDRNGVSIPIKQLVSTRAMNQQEVVLDSEMGIVLEDGTIVWTSVSAAPLPDGGAVVVTTDISERKRAEESLVESEQKLRAITSTATDAIVMIDENRNISYWNPATERILGYGSGEVMGKDINIIIPESYREAHERAFNRFVASGHPDHLRKTYEVTAIKKDGTEVPIELSISGVLLKSKCYSIGIMRDISDRKSLEKQLLQAQKMEAVGQLSGGIAHDFNNILTAIIGSGHLMSMRLSNADPLRVFVDQILASSERAAELTHSLLAFSRKQMIISMPVDINEIISGMRKILERIIGEDLEFNVHTSDNDLIAMADKGQIEQVLMNLATNARDAMPGGGTMTITTEEVTIDALFVQTHQFAKTGQYAVISVKDTGIGMDKTTQEHIFEPFFTTKGVGKGTGLGLAMVYGTIKQHNGFITVHSELGKGTTFKIALPLVTAQKLHSEKYGTATIARGNETLLLIEDDAAVRAVTKALLENLGYGVMEASNGERGIELYGKNRDKVQLVITDIIMPKLSGRDVHNELKKINPDVKILFMSGYTSDIIQQKGIENERVNFIAKPIRVEELSKKLREALDA